MTNEKTIQQYKHDQMRFEKTAEFNKILENTNIEVFIKPENYQLVLLSKQNESIMFEIWHNVLKEGQYIHDKLTELKPVFESLKNSTNDITHGYINLNYNEFNFIYKDSIQVEFRYKNNELKIKSMFKMKKQALHIPQEEGKIIISAGFNSKADAKYVIEKQMKLNEFNTNLLDEMTEKTIDVIQNTLELDPKDYPQTENALWLN